MIKNVNFDDNFVMSYNEWVSHTSFHHVYIMQIHVKM